MNKDTLIISLTSWPKRIQLVAKFIFSLLNQNVDKSLYHIVLVLCTEEFPNREKDLPTYLKLMNENNLFEIIWTPRNIYSHKKLMPTIAKYPNNAILVCDEDIIHPKDWLSYFIKDHKKYPTDILVGGCVYDVAFVNGKFNPTYKHYQDKPEFAGKEIINRRPANGYGGVLYPSGTFTDKRFYDIDLAMKLSKYSDESWQYCFNIIEHRTLRWISKIFNHNAGAQKGSFDTSMGKMRSQLKTITNYDTIYNTLFDAFPEFKTELQKKLNK